jgi:cytoskeletal protein CcmA (bactofilin family)
VEETDFTWGVADSLIDLHGGFAYLRLSDSTHATYNTDVLSEIMMSAEEIVLTADSVKFLSTIEVYSATALDSSLSVAGVTTLSDSLIGVTANFSGTFDVTGATGVDGDFDVNTDKFTVASATGNTAIAGTLDVTGVATLATVDINGGSIDGTTIGASTPSTVGATTIDASADVTFNGDNFVSYSETSIHNNLIVLDKTIGTTTQFSVNEANGNTMIAGNLDLNGDLDLDGDSVDINVTKVFNVSAVDSIRLISSDEIVRIQSVDTNVFVTAGNDINLNAADDFQVDAADDIHFEVGEDFEVNVLSDIELHAQDDIHIHAGWPSTPAGEESYIKLEVDGVGGDSSLVKLDTALFDIRSANFKLDGNSELNGDLEVTGDVELGSDLVVSANVDVNGTVELHDALNVSGHTDLNGDLEVTGDVELGSDLVVFANVDVDGTVELHDALTVSGDTELDDALTVNGDTDLNGDLDVVGTTTFTGDVKGHREKGDDELVTYDQLDSLSKTTPIK